ncbi:unnamed protein product [Phyllotreta striolata]|uniref:C-type lectin domain-containing protein n=1 Tax=Phyllotreta striolata TaxID=444603 RepID=A0A9N9TJV6_PHYSR|nr:unnamed protein product [Phyllotreta striolata]
MKVNVALCLFCIVLADAGTEAPEDDSEGIWSALLEKWATSKTTNNRQSRVMLIPISPNSFVAEDKMSNFSKESKVIPGKIVNNVAPQKISTTGGRQVSETDLYLLGAIEKLVYKVDFMEKRLRRVEEMLYYNMAGNRIDTEPCPNNYTRVGHECYHFNSYTGREFDWKVASKTCKKMGAFLAEMETIEENQDLVTYLVSTQHLRGRDFWVGGLNPGLLWIWSNSARPVAAPGSHNNKDNPSSAINGEGRCLRLAYNPALRSYSYRGTDCSMRYNFICEKPLNKSSNEIRRLGRSKNILSDEL